MPKSLNAPDCARFLKALGDPIRLRIVEFLEDGPQSVGLIAEHIGQEIANTSHHLHVLRDAGLVTMQRDGRFCYYSLAPEILIPGSSRLPNSLDFGCCRLELGRRESTR
jgi:DNA-binding transcriptional ArsR family regulator